MKLALAQINTTIGDFSGNVQRIIDATVRARSQGAELVVFPELSICGYPPMDLLDHAAFVEQSQRSLRWLQAHLPPEVGVIVGYVDKTPHQTGKSLQNVAALLSDGVILHRQAKRLLPTYDVFDEARYFEPGQRSSVVRFGGVRIGIAICEDIWWETEPAPGVRYPIDPVRDLADAGAELLVVPSASPFHSGKLRVRESLVSQIGRNNGIPALYVNLVGGNDSLIFDGYSFATNTTGAVTVRAKGFEDHIVIVESTTLGIGTPIGGGAPSPGGAKTAPPTTPPGTTAGAPTTAATRPTAAVGSAGTQDGKPASTAAVGAPEEPDGNPAGTATGAVGAPAEPDGQARQKAEPRSYTDDPARYEDLEAALILGVRDYLRKTGFSRVHLGLSGGIDSAVVAVIAARAIGPENVKAFLLPSQYSSSGSISDSEQLVRNLGISHGTLPIHDVVEAFNSALKGEFAGREPDVAEENIQARTRGTLLMAYSNKFGSLTLNTGNKSELAVGYATLYGDMAGALEVIGDLFKVEVYGLAHQFNRKGEVIPQTIIDKPPSAELRPDQKDQDSLPPYDVLDQILYRYLIESRTFSQIVALGYEPGIVGDILRKVGIAEYKRRQAPPVLKVSPRAFGTGRRMPIARAIYESNK